jgi:hypothetical protein
VQPKEAMSRREVELVEHTFRWALYAMTDACEATGEPAGRVLNMILHDVGWKQRLKQRLETWLDIQAELAEENARRANAGTPQPTTESREEPQQQNKESRRAPYPDIESRT